MIGGGPFSTFLGTAPGPFWALRQSGFSLGAGALVLLPGLGRVLWPGLGWSLMAGLALVSP